MMMAETSSKWPRFGYQPKTKIAKHHDLMKNYEQQLPVRGGKRENEGNNE